MYPFHRAAIGASRQEGRRSSDEPRDHPCRIDLLAAPRYNLLTISGVANRQTWHRIEAALRCLGELMRPTVLLLDGITEFDLVALHGLTESVAERRSAGQPPILLRSAAPELAAMLAAAGLPAVTDPDALPVDALAG